MSLESITLSAIYASMVAEDATYIDQSGAETAVRVVPVHDSIVLPDGADIGRNSESETFRIRSSEVAGPVLNDAIEYEGYRYTVDGYTKVSPSEWLLFVMKGGECG